jgi:hypothetical protein
LADLMGGQLGLALGVGVNLEAAASHAITIIAAHNNSQVGNTGPSMATAPPLHGKTGRIGRIFGDVAPATAAFRSDEDMQLDASEPRPLPPPVAAIVHTLLDHFVCLAACNRCTAPYIKRLLEWVLLLPILPLDIEQRVASMLPDICLFTASFGMSSVARELSQSSPTGENAIVAAEAVRAIKSPWKYVSFVLPNVTGIERKERLCVDMMQHTKDLATLCESSSIHSISGLRGGSEGRSVQASTHVLADLHSPLPMSVIAAVAHASTGAYALDFAAMRSGSPSVYDLRRCSIPCISKSIPLHFLSQMEFKGARRTPSALSMQEASNYVGSIPVASPFGPNGGMPRSSVMEHRSLFGRIFAMEDLFMRAQQISYSEETETKPTKQFESCVRLPRMLCAPSDPLCIEMTHTPLPRTNAVLLHVRVLNMTEVHIPSGTTFSLHLSGPAVFDGTALLAQSLVSAGRRVVSPRQWDESPGSALVASGASATAAATAALLTGNSATTLMGSSSGDAVIVCGWPLWPSAAISFDVSVYFTGAGEVSVKVSVALHSVDSTDENEDKEPELSVPARVRQAARATRAIGLTHADDIGAPCDDMDVDWSRTAAELGKFGDAWATGTADGPSDTDVLLWCGPGLDDSRKSSALPMVSAGSSSSGSQPVAIVRQNAGRNAAGASSQRRGDGVAAQPNAALSVPRSPSMSSRSQRRPSYGSTGRPDSVAGGLDDAKTRDGELGGEDNADEQGSVTDPQSEDGADAGEEGGDALSRGFAYDNAVLYYAPARIQCMEFTSSAYIISSWFDRLLPLSPRASVSVALALFLRIASASDVLVYSLDKKKSTAVVPSFAAVGMCPSTAGLSMRKPRAERLIRAGSQSYATPTTPRAALELAKRTLQCVVHNWFGAWRCTTQQARGKPAYMVGAEKQGSAQAAVCEIRASFAACTWTGAHTVAQVSGFLCSSKGTPDSSFWEFTILLTGDEPSVVDALAACSEQAISFCGDYSAQVLPVEIESTALLSDKNIETPALFHALRDARTLRSTLLSLQL